MNPRASWHRSHTYRDNSSVPEAFRLRLWASRLRASLAQKESRGAKAFLHQRLQNRSILGATEVL